MFADSTSLWAAWIKSNRIKEESLWSCDVEKAKLWTWRSLLHLRPLASRFLRAKLGDGKRISFWWDIWTPLGRLIEIFGDEGLRELSIPSYASVSDACNSNGWRLRGARSPSAEALQIYLTTIPLPNSNTTPDTFYWLVDDKPLNKFSTKLTWEVLRQRFTHQPWSSHVWFRGAILKHSFLMWLAQLDRLPTRSRLFSWGLNIPTSCFLCDAFIKIVIICFCDANGAVNFGTSVFEDWDISTRDFTLGRLSLNS